MTSPQLTIDDELAHRTPAPPTGPAAVVPARDAGRYRAYLTWKAGSQGAAAVGWIAGRAWELACVPGVSRITVNRLVEEARVAFGAINNTWRAWIADDLVTANPALLDLIERRTRKKPKV
jgi:hypothetical protein